MRIRGLKVPGERMVVLELDWRTAVDVYLHLAGSMHAELTTMSSRTHVGALLPQFRRAIVHTGMVDWKTLDDLARELSHTPAPPPLDVTARTRPEDA